MDVVTLVIITAVVGILIGGGIAYLLVGKKTQESKSSFTEEDAERIKLKYKEEVEAELSRRWEEVEERERLLNERERSLDRKWQSLEKREEEIYKWERDLRTLEREIRNLERSVEEKERMLEELSKQTQNA